MNMLCTLQPERNVDFVSNIPAFLTDSRSMRRKNYTRNEVLTDYSMGQTIFFIWYEWYVTYLFRIKISNHWWILNSGTWSINCLQLICVLFKKMIKSMKQELYSKAKIVVPICSSQAIIIRFYKLKILFVIFYHYSVECCANAFYLSYENICQVVESWKTSIFYIY